MTATLYLNLEDDIAKIVTKLKREKAVEIVLVCPKRSFLFSDSINLRLLKKKVDLLGKNVAILTMDEQGQAYAKQAGFVLKHMPRPRRLGSFSDIRPTRRMRPVLDEEDEMSEQPTFAQKIKKAVAQTIAPVIRPTIAPAISPAIAPAIRSSGIPTRKPVAAKPASQTRRVIKSKTSLSVSVAKSPVATVRGPDNVYTDPVAGSGKPAKNKKSRSRKGTAWIVSFVGLCLILLLVLILFVLPSADVTVYGKSQTIGRDIDMNLDSKVAKPDAASLAMPAVPFDETPEATITIQTTGKKEIGSKAEGQVAIYNLTGQAMNLKASTTVLSIGTKNYQFTEDQNNIKPATSASDDKNATIARVIAQDGGESFNAPSATRLEITNQAFGAQPQRLFAKASTQIIGGNSRFISVVSDDDIKNGQGQLKDKLLQQVKDKLKQQNLILLDDASTLTTNEFTPDKISGTESPTVTVSGKLRITGLAFDESALREILRNRISNSLAPGRKLQPVESDTITYKVKSINVEAGTLALSLHYESQAKISLDSTNLSSKILGKSKQETTEILLSNEAIDKVEILLHPSWQQNTPLFKGKINLTVKE